MKPRLFTRTLFQNLCELLSAAIAFVTAAAVILSWNSLPERLPSGYNAEGVADSFSGKPMLLLFLGIQIAGYLLITAISFFPHRWNMPFPFDERQKPAAYSFAYTFISVMKLLLVASFGYLVWCTGTARPFNGWIIAVFVVLMIANIAAYFVRMFRLSLACARQQVKEELDQERREEQNND